MSCFIVEGTDIPTFLIREKSLRPLEPPWNVDQDRELKVSGDKIDRLGNYKIKVCKRSGYAATLSILDMKPVKKVVDTYGTNRGGFPIAACLLVDLCQQPVVLSAHIGPDCAEGERARLLVVPEQRVLLLPNLHRASTILHYHSQLKNLN